MQSLETKRLENIKHDFGNHLEDSGWIAKNELNWFKETRKLSLSIDYDKLLLIVDEINNGPYGFKIDNNLMFTSFFYPTGKASISMCSLSQIFDILKL